jgi:GT2 family glycosyltransferase
MGNRATEPTAPTATTKAPTVTVIVCAYTWRRWEVLREGMAAIARQRLAPAETILVIDHNPAMLERARKEFPEASIHANNGKRGISCARNLGVEVANGDILAFLDDDAVPDEDWLAELTHPYSDPHVIGTGGTPRPRWESASAPDWLPLEFYWTIGCGYRGLPRTVAPVRNPIGATMSFRADVFARIGGFHVGLGRVQATPLGCEETELAIRARKAFPDGAIMHAPEANVEHLVPSDRATWSYFRSRCWLEGQSKALMTDEVGAADGLSAEWDYTLKILPTGVLRGIRDALRGDRAGLRRAGAILAGLAITSGGYLKARLSSAR